MKLALLAPFLWLGLTASPLLAEEKGTLLFEDDFERNESQEKTDEIGKGWGSNSKSRAKGNKQVDLRNGAMYIYIHKEADHGVSVTHPAEFTNGAIEMRFMLEGEKDRLGLNFADLKFKEVHAGHLFAARIGIEGITLQDLKTGRMNQEIRTARTEGKLTPEQNKLIKSKEKTFPKALETGTWYNLLCEIEGETISVTINDEKVATFSSEGIAHPTKRTLRLAVPKNAVVDDVKIWKRD